jgi:U3 small nucleolar RNA-associated protein 10
LRRRAQALIVFVGHAFKAKASVANAPEGEGSISTVITQLVELSELPDGKSTETKVEEIKEAAHTLMNKLLSLMSVPDFINAVHSMLGSGDTKVRLAS